MHIHSTESGLVPKVKVACPLIRLLDGLSGRGPVVPVSRIEALPLCECGDPLELEIERNAGMCVGCQRVVLEAGHGKA
jgi:hypothetical protein